MKSRFKSLFDTKARARCTDPNTSHIAARKTEKSGKAVGQRLMCQVEVWKHPGLTAAEIATAIELERHIPSRRLPELREVGLVYNGESRVCRVTGSKSMTWWPVGEES